MSNVEFNIQIASIGEDEVIGVKPPVDHDLRTRIYEDFSKLGIMMEVAGRNTLFQPMYSKNGELYSELRVSHMALEMLEVKLIDLAHLTARKLLEQGKAQDQDRSVHVAPFLRRQLFSDDT
jgi:hypothetical protein